MKVFLGSLVAGVTLLAGDLYLLPDSFLAAVGERLIVRAHDGRKFPTSSKEPILADSAIYTSKAAYNLLNPRHEGNALVLEGNLKMRGTTILAAESQQHTDFAKALVIVEVPDQNFKRQLGTTLELVPDENPKKGENTFQLFHHRKPLPNSPFELLSDAGSLTSNHTDAHGRGLLRIAKPGRYLLRASHADLSASLTFEVR